jgi:hypothetical protein
MLKKYRDSIAQAKAKNHTTLQQTLHWYGLPETQKNEMHPTLVLVISSRNYDGC